MTWDSLFQLAGKSGLTISEFYEMTPQEFYCWVRGRADTELESYKRIAELNRIFTMMLINTQLGKKPIKDPKKLIKFGWEVEKAVKLSAEDVAKLKDW